MVRPAAPPKQNLPFGHTIAVDLRTEHDIHDESYNMLDVLCLGKKFSMYIVVPSKSPAEVVEALMCHWCAVANTPEIVVHDQGGEFSVGVIDLMEHWGEHDHM